jgi:hypothetical protein
VDPVVAVLALILLTATVATIFSVVRRKGQGAQEAVAGIALGWLLFLSPLYFFGPTGAILGAACIMIVGAIVGYASQHYERQPPRR